MKTERSNVEFAIWRKKVDKSLFEHNGTTIPEWACRMWGLSETYSAITSRKDPASVVSATFKSRTYRGWVTTAPHGRQSPAFPLWYEPELTHELKHAFLMSYMRSLEGLLDRSRDVEADIPFWEFLDIEYDHASREFRFVAHYTAHPAFPKLFKRLVGSPAIKRVEED